MHTLSVRISSWPVRSGYASVPDPYAEHVLKGLRFVHALVPDPYAQCTHQFLTRMLGPCISSWRVYSSYTSVPDTHAQCTHQFLSRMLRVHTLNIWKIGKLMCTLTMHVRNWCIWCASVPDPCAQRTQKGRSMRLRNLIFSIIWAPSKREARRFLEKSACSPSCESLSKIPRHLVQLLAIRILIPNSAHRSASSLHNCWPIL
jgi:hypothetical protein